MYREVPDWSDVDEKRVDYDQDETQLCRSHASESELELTLKVRIYIYGDRQEEIDDQYCHCDAEVHDLR